MNIAIIGGGNVGTLMAAEFAYKGHNVKMYTSKPERWSKDIDVYSAAEELLFSGRISKVTDSLREALEDAEYIWITLPAFLFGKLANEMFPYVGKGQYIGIIPGTGGAEFAFRRLLQKGCILFGLQRVHSIARVKEYGKSVYMLGRKEKLYLGAIPSKENIAVSSVIEELFDIQCRALDNYLSVTLTPSNPILHTTRIYALFKNYNEKKVYPRNVLFYEEWDDESSEYLIACDKELQTLCNKIPISLSSVLSLRDYYESFTVQSMTRKIKGIEAFRGIMSPMKQTENGWIPDLESRYFTADFPWGIKVIKEISIMFEIMTPNINKIWNWYKNNMWNMKDEVFELTLDKEKFLELYQ